MERRYKAEIALFEERERVAQMRTQSKIVPKPSKKRSIIDAEIFCILLKSLGEGESITASKETMEFPMELNRLKRNHQEGLELHQRQK
jgi:hypothetical protein